MKAILTPAQQLVKGEFEKMKAFIAETDAKINRVRLIDFLDKAIDACMSDTATPKERERSLLNFATHAGISMHQAAEIVMASHDIDSESRVITLQLLDLIK